jgi:hypothetical protein
VVAGCVHLLIVRGGTSQLWLVQSKTECCADGGLHFSSSRSLWLFHRRVGRWRGLDNVSNRLQSMGRPNGEEEAPLVDTVVRICCFWTVLAGPMAHLGTAPTSFFSIFSGKMRPAFPASRSFSPADFDSLLHALSDRSIHLPDNTVPQVGLR